MDATMYGAFWCSHCYDQKQAFGQEAYRRIRYVECAPDGVDSQTKLCRSRKVRCMDECMLGWLGYVPIVIVIAVIGRCLPSHPETTTAD